MAEMTSIFVGAIMVAVAVYLLCQRWFWAMALGLSALVSVFAVLASIIHFQILTAVGFAVLALVLSIALARPMAGL